LTQSADYFAVIGTSLQVYPAAGLLDYTPKETPIFYIDPKPIQIPNLKNPLEVIAEIASIGVEIMRNKLLSDH
jgi:NAD-dependent deacetylase